MAFCLRGAGIDFGLPMAEARPDEMTIAFQAMKFGTGDLNPHSFNYPSLHKYVVFGLFGGWYALGSVLGEFEGKEDFLREFFNGAVDFRLIMRAWSVVMGTAVVALVVRVSPWGGALLAVSFLPVRDSHFGVSDTMMVTLAVAAVLAAVRSLDTGDRRWVVASAVLAGLATSTKYNAGLTAIPLAMAAWHQGGAVAVARAGGVMVVAFLLGTPYALLDVATFQRDFLYEVRHLGSGHFVDVGNGWGHHLGTILLTWGAAPLLFALAGMLATVREGALRAAVLYSFPVAYYATIGGGETAFFRYILPVFPFLCIAAGNLLGRLRPPIAIPLVIGLAAPTTWASFQVDRLFLAGDTRDAMGRWIEAEVPTGAVIVHAGAYTAAPMVQRNVANQTREYEAKQGRADAAGFRKPDDARWYTGTRPMYDVLFVDKPGIDFASRLPVSALLADPPEWLLLESYFLTHYSHIPAEVRSLATDRYDLVHEEHAFTPPVAGTFDQQDALYLPASGFAGFHRTGPTLSLYRRR